MARAPRQWRAVLLMLVILPFWTSFLIRVYAWIGILKKEGLLNLLLLNLGIINRPLTILNTDRRLYRHCLFLLAVHDIALYANLDKMDMTCWRLPPIWVINP